jgi:hypothetical protein
MSKAWCFTAKDVKSECNIPTCSSLKTASRNTDNDEYRGMVGNPGGIDPKKSISHIDSQILHKHF